MLALRLRGNGAVIHAVNFGDGCHQIGQDISGLHSLGDRSGHIFGEQSRAVGALKELFHHVGASAANLNVKPLQLALISVQAGKLCVFITGAGVQLLQHQQAVHLGGKVQDLLRGRGLTRPSFRMEAFSPKTSRAYW